MSDLETILSGGGEAVAEAPVVEEAVTQVADGESQQEQIAEAERPEGQEATSSKMVPHEALHAEKQKVKRYTEEVADFRKSNESLQRQVAELLQRIPVPQQQQEQAPDWYADPDAALEQRLGKSISPLANTVSSLQTQLVRLTAVQTYGAEKVGAFESYIEEAAAKGDPELQALGAQMRASPDPMKVGLDWFEKRTFDPEKERERIRAELLAEVQPNGAQQQAQQRTPSVTPSNFASARNVGNRSNGPEWSGPAPIQDIFNRTR